MICSSCQAWMQPLLDREAGIARCPECGHTAPHRFLPLFVVTGPSGTGKTAVVHSLAELLPDWEVFETDILWDSGGDWSMVKCNWLRIADSLAQRPHPRPTILCGTMQPAELAMCETLDYFRSIHWLALVCDPETLAARLRARPAWRGCDDAFIARQLSYLAWLHENAHAASDPPITLVDTTHSTVVATAQKIRDWAVDRWSTPASSPPPPAR